MTESTEGIWVWLDDEDIADLEDGKFLSVEGHGSHVVIKYGPRCHDA